MASSTESPRILVVEDNDALRRIVVRVLDDAGYAVTAVHGGLEALEELHTHCPSLMITDNRMPGMSGNAFIAEARARFPEMAILRISGAATFPDADESVPTLGKPFTAKDLLAAVRADSTAPLRCQRISVTLDATQSAFWW